jgi:translation elongation factor EF-Tu-like GTPase
MAKRVAIIAHVDHGKSSLAAALAHVMSFRADLPKTDEERRTDAIIAKRLGHNVKQNR